MGGLHRGLRQGGLPAVRRPVALPGVDRGVTNDQILNVVKKYEAELSKDGRVAERFVGGFPSEGAFPTREAALRHLLWMISEIKQQVSVLETAEEAEKIMRWLGFVQGVLWMSGTKSINEMRDDNRS